MATRKAITLVSGLFQEVNTPTDKLDFAGNTTADLNENTNLYFTNTRARSAVSVTDAGGLGSLAYNSSTGVITYTGPSNSDIRGLLSIASGSGLTYNSGTGEFGTSAIPNSQLANDDITIGSTAVALGATTSTLAGLGSVSTGELFVPSSDAANSVRITSANIVFEGATADNFETFLRVTDATADRIITFPDESGNVLTDASSIANSNLANSAVTLGATSVALGTTASTISGLTSLTATTLVAGSGANSILLASGSIQFEGSTANDFETSLTVTDPTADRTITFPDATGTVALLTSLSIASGSGLTYNSSTGEFSTNAIPNSQLANSSVTVGSTAIALGNSSTTLAGLSSVTSTAVVTNDSGFRIRDNSDNTKQLAFECSGISTSTTRTLTVPDENGTLVTSGAIVNADINASAAIAASKIDGSSFATNITTTQSLQGAAVNISGTIPVLNFTDTDGNPDYRMQVNTGTFLFRDQTNDVTRVTMASDGTTTFANNVNFSSGIDVTGNITVTGTVDGVDVATRDTLFGGLTSSSGALTNGVTATTQSASDNSTKVATTAYVDNAVSPEFADNVFRIKDNSDATKKLAFECSGISGSTTRTMTVPDSNGTISTESFATAIAVALG